MKKHFFIVTLLVVISFAFITDTKTLKVEGSLDDWNKHYYRLETIKSLVDKSNLPHQEVAFIFKSIDSLEMFILPQLQKQLRDTTKPKSK